MADGREATKVTQPQVRVGFLLLNKKAIRGKDERLRLLPHEEVEQHRNAGEDEAAQKEGIDEGHARSTATPNSSREVDDLR